MSGYDWIEYFTYMTYSGSVTSRFATLHPLMKQYW